MPAARASVSEANRQAAPISRELRGAPSPSCARAASSGASSSAAPAAAGARGAVRRACVRLLAPGIVRNFDAGLADPAPGPYHRFSGHYYTHDMNEYARAPRVLVVEDDEDIAQALQRSLRMEGYEVRAAPDGRSALEHGRAFAPDLVILDLGLPELDGIEVARTMRAEADVPILILTARD